MNQINKKIFASIISCMILISTCSNTIFALTELTEGYIQKIGQADYHLKYYNEAKEKYTYVVCSVVGHYYNGNFYPAYCMNKNLNGVGESGSYNVDVQDVIDNEQIWRAVKNGYPYKNAEDLGLTSDYDAFTVTKMAVYCLTGQSDLNLFTADEDDYEGQAMLKALNNLVEIGKNGKDTQKNSLKIIKTGDFIEEGEYFSIKYKVQSSVELKKYDIKELSNFPNGTLVTDISGNINTSFSGTQEFKVKVPKNKLNSDIKGKISIKAESKTYPIFYGKTRISGTQDYILTGDSYGAQTAEIETDIKTNNGKIIVNKVDKDTKQSIEGITFSLLDSNKNLIRSEITNSDGKATFDNLYQGKYIIKETKSNEEYEINNNEFWLDVEYNKTSNIQIEDKHTIGNLKIHKIDKDNKAITLGDIEFDLYSQELGKVIGTYYTNANGEINIEGLRTGKYSLIEKNTNKWYNASENTQIEIKPNKVVEIIVENELKKGSVKIEKIDSENSSIKIANVKFEVYDQNMNKLEEITTNNEGIAYTSKYAVRDYKKLYIKEKETNKAYKLDTKTYEVDLKENDITNLTIANQRKRGKIKVVKTDKDNENVYLDGVEFEIRNSKGETVDKIKTNQKGEAITKELPLGEEYEVIEINTKENYALAKESQKIKLEDEQIQTLKFENEKKKGKIRIIKVDKDNNEVLLEGAEFNILNFKGEKVDTVITNKNGEAESKNLPIDEQYTIVETKTNEAYVLSQISQAVTLKENEITTIKFENEKRKGKIKVIKVDKDNNEILLEGVEFDVLNSKGEKVDTIITNKNGEAESKNLSIDEEYKVVETKTKENYVLNDENQTVKLEENQITNITFENEKKKGKIQIIKVDKDDNEVYLEGVKFNILNSKGEVVDTVITNERGEVESKSLPIDEEYSVIETETQAMYLLTDEVQKVTLEENQITNIKFENEKKKGQIKIIKQSKDDNIITGKKTGTPLENVEFEIYNEQNEFVEKINTNNEGIAISSKLPIGKYKLKETKTEEWYILNNKYYEALIEENNQTIVLEIQNESVKPKIELEKRGTEKAQPGEEIKYEFNIKNKSNVKLGNFIFIDKIPTDYIKVTKIETGTFNNSKKYDLYYKTNLTNDFVLLMEDLSTDENNQIDFTREIADNEFITEIKYDFKTVDIGFKENTKPIIYANIKESVKSEETFVNESFIEADYNGYRVRDESKWKTMCYKILPLTGM